MHQVQTGGPAPTHRKGRRKTEQHPQLTCLSAGLGFRSNANSTLTLAYLAPSFHTSPPPAASSRHHYLSPIIVTPTPRVAAAFHMWSETPIRDRSCCCHPLTGVPYLRPGPRRPNRRADLAGGASVRRGCAGTGSRLSRRRKFRFREDARGGPEFWSPLAR